MSLLPREERVLSIAVVYSIKLISLHLMDKAKSFTSLRFGLEQ